MATREEVMSSGGTMNLTPTASSVGASSPAVPTNIGSVDCSSHGHISRVDSLCGAGSQWWTGGSGVGSSRPPCRPWERDDLLRRLSTFKPSNWSGKPKVVSSLACAQKGWINVGSDQISCESCGAHLNFLLLSTTLSSSEGEKGAEAYAREVENRHELKCPWRGSVCPPGLVQFPPSQHSSLVGGYNDRCEGLSQFDSLPAIAASTLELMHASRGSMLERIFSIPPTTSVDGDYKIDCFNELDFSRDTSSVSYLHAQKIISLCGWEPRWLLSVQDREEHSAQSERNGCSFTPSRARPLPKSSPKNKKGMLSPSAIKGKKKIHDNDSSYEQRSPLLDCSLCGSTVRIRDFVSLPHPTRFALTPMDVHDTTKKAAASAVARGVSETSGINGDTERYPSDNREEAATTSEMKYLPDPDIDLNLSLTSDPPFPNLIRTSRSPTPAGIPSSSDAGGHATSYESRGPSFHNKRSLDIAGSSEDRVVVRPSDSVEGVVIDHDANDDVIDRVHSSDGPSKRARNPEMLDLFGAAVGPSRRKNERSFRPPSTRESARASSVIAVDTEYNGSGEDSMDSVENHPGDVDDAHFPSSSGCGNVDASSNQAQQSTCFQPGGGDVGVSSTNDGEEIWDGGEAGLRARHGFSGGSVGMCASHEAEIHGAGTSVRRTNSFVGDVEARVEDGENQGQTGESVPGPGLTDEVVPEEVMARGDGRCDSEEMSQSFGKGDSGSKFNGSTRAESVESREKIRVSVTSKGKGRRPSISFDNLHNSGNATSIDVMRARKTSPLKEQPPCLEPDYVCVDGLGPLKGESNYERREFDPLLHHSVFCPWVNGNVAAAGSCCAGHSSSASTKNNNNNNCMVAVCGWELTVDALDASTSTNHFPTVQSESAASLQKVDHESQNGKKLLRIHSGSNNIHHF